MEDDVAQSLAKEAFSKIEQSKQVIFIISFHKNGPKVFVVK